MHTKLFERSTTASARNDESLFGRFLPAVTYLNRSRIEMSESSSWSPWNRFYDENRSCDEAGHVADPRMAAESRGKVQIERLHNRVQIERFHKSEGVSKRSETEHTGHSRRSGKRRGQKSSKPNRWSERRERETCSWQRKATKQKSWTKSKEKSWTKSKEKLWTKSEEKLQPTAARWRKKLQVGQIWTKKCFSASLLGELNT